MQNGEEVACKLHEFLVPRLQAPSVQIPKDLTLAIQVNSPMATFPSTMTW